MDPSHKVSSGFVSSICEKPPVCHCSVGDMVLRISIQYLVVESPVLMVISVNGVVPMEVLSFVNCVSYSFSSVSNVDWMPGYNLWQAPGVLCILLC